MGCLNILLRKYFYDECIQEKKSLLKVTKSCMMQGNCMLTMYQKSETVTNVVSEITFTKIVVKYT